MAHSTFIAAGQQEQEQMLSFLDAKDFDDLFKGIPAALQTDDYRLPSGLTEMEMIRHIRDLAGRNDTHLLNFCGAGFYDHFIPAAVDSLTSRGEFFTAYTPYQPEAAQGTLQAIYEFQTAIARLTDMEVANASLYDGGTALFEGMMMALRSTRRSRVLVDEGVNPIYRTMLRCYTQNLNIAYEEIALRDGVADRDAFREALNDDVAAVLVQNPNFFGCVSDLSDLVEMAHHVGAMVVASMYPISLGLLKTPGAMGVDVVTGEGQSLGLPLSFGGPYLGFMATRKKFVRKMPGRIVGATRDKQGRRGYVLTLQAREQHIRREKATSNICTNEALCALRATVYLALAGRQGFVDIARTCASRAAYARKQLLQVPGVTPAFAQPFFNEFTIHLPCEASGLVSRLLNEEIAAGFPAGRYYSGMENHLILAFTEKHTRDEIDRLAGAIGKVI
ncbi:MAG: aminomethyl-transferring glycine dehydrogenase subunit GcvPA [Spartobacteria bacterium]|nr:aminomethyl-transferring glycine dehydrogenase subunit GcvPA [Spartobacteria bacterium]